MINICPNKSHKDWKAIEAKYGEDIAYAAYIKNGEEIPSLSYVDNLFNKNSNQNFKKQEDYLKNIKNIITSQLEQLGVGIGALTEYESKVGIEGNTINGVFDPTATKKTAEGLIELIRIAQDNRGLQALPEEFSHLVDTILKGTNNPIYDRLTNLLKNEEVIKSILEQERPGSYDMYYSIYKGDINKLADEARAKLIAKHIIRNEEIKASPWQRLMQRFKELFNKVFSKGDVNNLQYQLYQADEEYGKFAAALMGGQVELNINLNSMQNKHMLYNAQSNLSRAEASLKKIIETEHKRLKIFESNKRLTEEQENLLNTRNINLNRLESIKNQKRFDEGILNFISQAYEDMDGLIQKLDTLKLHNNTPTSDINSTAKFLRDLKSYLNAYAPIVKDLNSYTLTEEYKSQDLFDLVSPLKDLTYILNRAETQYNEAALPLFTQFIKQFTGNLIGSKINGKTVTEDYLQSIITEASSDIGFMDRWLYSMAESSDLMLRLIERPSKNARFKAKELSDEAVIRLQEAQEDLEKAGYKTDFIYERDDKGNLTGKYIQELDWAKFYKDQEAEEERLTKLYGNKNNSSDWWKEFYKWREHNMTEDSSSKRWLPKSNKYSNKAYTSLAPAQKTFYDKIIEIKQEVDALLPENKMNPYLLPQIRKDFLERLKESKSIKEARKLVGSGIADNWVARESDDEFGSRYGLQDFDGTQLNTLPVYYTTKLSDMNQLSTDIVSSMALYADMAYNYDAMNKIIDIMEVGKDIMSNRQIDETIGGKSVKEVINREGRKIENRIFKKKGSSRFEDRLKDFYESQIYGKTQKEQGSFKLPFIDSQISVAKAANNLNQLTALNTYALNILSGVSNVTMGKVMTRIESISGQFFNMKDIAWADKTYAAQIPSVLGQIGARRKTNKLDLMIIKFNVLQDHEKALREIEMNKKNIFTRLCNSSALFFLNNMGEHYMQTRSFLALAHRLQLKDSSGKDINLWDAYEVVKGKDGIERLQIKKGVTKQDGSEYSSEDIEKLSRKSARINQKLHGIYNKEDMNAFQRTAQGRLVMMFRKWVIPSLNRRFQGENYSFDLDDVEQGYYNSTYQFLKTLAQDLKSHQFNLGMRWKELNPTQRANALRAVAEVGQFLALVIGFTLLSGAWDGDDEWYKSFTLYQMRRLQTELGVLIPTIYTQFKEGLTLLKSPAAGINYTENLLNLLRVWDIWDEPIQSGTYKGWNRYYRDIVRTLPLHNTIRRAMSPEEALKFYTLSN